MKKPILLLAVAIASATLASAQIQKPNIKFGKVSAADFEPSTYEIDPDAAAVVLADMGSTAIEGNSKGWFSLHYKRMKRVRILKKSGYDIADVEIPLYTSGRSEEELSSLKAVTYNLEDGKVVETKLEKGSIFKDQKSKNWVVQKFTFPNIKEGSIIEYSMEIESDFLFNLQPWEFQGAYPRLWSEYQVSIPEFMGYVFLTQGYRPYDLNDRKMRRTTYRIRDNGGAGASELYTMDAGVTDYDWAMQNVPALKEESFTSTIDNHVSKIDFQLQEYRYPLTYRNIMGNWASLTKALNEDESFGKDLARNNNWLGEVVDPLLAGAKTDLEKAKKIFYYVNHNYSCTDNSDRYFDENLKAFAKKKSGGVADINLLLTAMLKYAGLQADPVLLSTRSHGYAYSIYPLINKFNYVVARAYIDDKEYMLDASKPELGFGHMLPECYNGHARLINEMGAELYFPTDSITEKEVISTFISTDDNGEMVGTVSTTPGFYSSYRMRDKLKTGGKEAFFKDVQTTYGSEFELSSPEFEQFDNTEESLKFKYKFKLNGTSEDLIYLNPLLKEGWKENPFKSAERFYPVEMPYCIDETYVFTAVVPEGYEIDELPKSMIVKLNEAGDGQYEYRISASANMISLRSRLTIKRTVYSPEEYDYLREFFNMVVKKQAEQIVLKKKTAKP